MDRRRLHLWVLFASLVVGVWRHYLHGDWGRAYDELVEWATTSSRPACPWGADDRGACLAAHAVAPALEARAKTSDDPVLKAAAAAAMPCYDLRRAAGGGGEPDAATAPGAVAPLQVGAACPGKNLGRLTPRECAAAAVADPTCPAATAARGGFIAVNEVGGFCRCCAGPSAADVLANLASVKRPARWTIYAFGRPVAAEADDESADLAACEAAAVDAARALIADEARKLGEARADAILRTRLRRFRKARLLARSLWRTTFADGLPSVDRERRRNERKIARYRRRSIKAHKAYRKKYKDKLYADLYRR